MLRATTLSGFVELQERAISDLRKRLSGPLIVCGDAGYDEARTIWNRMIDRRPALIARCAGTDDVVTALRFAREHGLLISVRGGGHNVTGNAVCDGGLMIDLSPMKSARVDPRRRRITAEPGLTWKDFDTATLRHGLATTGGIVSSTGVAGLTLGGGHGWLMRKHGLACDNVSTVDVAVADGRCLRASADENPELFLGVRGGGGNLGIVTSFEFQLHPLTTVLAGFLLFPRSQARDVGDLFRQQAPRAPLAVTAVTRLHRAPRRRDGARRSGRDCVRSSQGTVRSDRDRGRVRGLGDGSEHRLGARDVGRDAPVHGGRGLCEFPRSRRGW